IDPRNVLVFLKYYFFCHNHSPRTGSKLLKLPCPTVLLATRPPLRQTSIVSTRTTNKNEETTGFQNEVSIYIQLNVFLQVEENSS
ncbi:MAG: hypothetical protein KKH22_04875, partial [Proteobacteria bacterium]|nr:hypothetical protein [Pseudomonadota bacterium]